MDTYGEIARRLKEIVGTNGFAPLFIAEVVSVEGDTCTVSYSGMDIPDVLLTPADDAAEGKMTITPKTGSHVLVADLSGGDLRTLAVVHWGEVERIEINGGELGGLVNIESLKSNLDALKNYVETMKTAIANAFTSVGVSNAASGPTGRATFESQMSSQQINFEDMEDTNILH